MTARLAVNRDISACVRLSVRVSRVSEMLDCDESDVRRLVDAGDLESHGIGKRGVRIYLDSVAEYQASKTRRPKRVVDKPVKPPQASRAAHLAAETELRKAGIIP